jgi:hypothetical protein
MKLGIGPFERGKMGKPKANVDPRAGRTAPVLRTGAAGINYQLNRQEAKHGSGTTLVEKGLTRLAEKF